MHGQQAKIVSPTQEQAMRGSLATTRYPSQDRVMFLLSIKVGLCAKEMASLTWAMVTDAQGQVAEVMHVANRAQGRTPLGIGRQSCIRRAIIDRDARIGVGVVLTPECHPDGDYPYDLRMREGSLCVSRGACIPAGFTL
jgi:hypothetical protein